MKIVVLNNPPLPPPGVKQVSTLYTGTGTGAAVVRAVTRRRVDVKMRGRRFIFAVD